MPQNLIQMRLPWPSHGTLRGYLADGENLQWAAPAIRNYIRQMVQQVGPGRVHLLAHSMGNRAALKVMQQLVGELDSETALQLGHVIYAAPDVDAYAFRTGAEAIGGLVTRRATMYASDHDVPVGLSRWLHANPRAGVTPPITVAKGVDTIIVPGFDVDWLGHSSYAAAEPMLRDLFALLHHNTPPGGRFGLDPKQTDDGQAYWQLSQAVRR